MTAADLKKMESGELRMFLALNRRRTFKFWLENLKIIAPKESRVTADQRRYVARFMTRFSLVSTTHSMFYFPTFSGIAQLYDEFMPDAELRGIPEIMEIAGCQSLLLGGFYLKAAEKHYNVEDIAKTGKVFFKKGAIGKRKKVVMEMAQNFSRWQHLLCYLEWYLGNERLVIQNIKKSDEPLIKIVPR